MTKPTIVTPAKYVEIDTSKLESFAGVMAMRSVLISFGINPHLLSKAFGHIADAGYSSAIPGYSLVQWAVFEHGDVTFPLAMESNNYQIIGFDKDGNAIKPIGKPSATGAKFAGYVAFVVAMKKQG